MKGTAASSGPALPFLDFNGSIGQNMVIRPCILQGLKNTIWSMAIVCSAAPSISFRKISMVTYPVIVGRSHYRGKNRQAKQIVAAENRHALHLEEQVNALLLQQQSPIQSYSWEQIAETTGIALRWVEKFGPTIDGSNLDGLTAWKNGMTYEEAMAADQ
jgi:hypothetical protein